MTTRSELMQYFIEAGVNTRVTSFRNLSQSIDSKKDFTDSEIVGILFDISNFLEAQTNPARNLRRAGLSHGVLKEIGNFFVS